MEERYHEKVMSQEHGYGEIISSIEFEKEVFAEVDKDHFVEGLAEYFYVEREIESSSGRDAWNRAQEIYEGDISDIKFSEEKAIEVVEDAIELGYIWKFKLDYPWHPAIFYDDDRLTTVPWQHKYVVAYTGRSESEFFSNQFCSNEGLTFC